MTAVVVAIVALLAVCMGFLAWASLRALGATVRMAMADTAHLPKSDRLLHRIVGFGGPLFMVVAGLIGIAVRPDPNVYKSELMGLAIGGVAWIGAMALVTFRAASRKHGTS